MVVICNPTNFLLCRYYRPITSFFTLWYPFGTLICNTCEILCAHGADVAGKTLFSLEAREGNLQSWLNLEILKYFAFEVWDVAWPQKCENVRHLIWEHVPSKLQWTHTFLKWMSSKSRPCRQMEETDPTKPPAGAHLKRTYCIPSFMCTLSNVGGHMICCIKH